MLSVEEKVRTVVSDAFCVGIDRVVADARLVLDLEADSMDKLELLMRLETEFDIELDDDALESAQTVADLVCLVEAKRAAA